MVSRTVHLPYIVEQDEDGVWCARAQPRPGVGAHGEGDSREAAIADLREALIGLIAEFGIPDEFSFGPLSWPPVEQPLAACHGATAPAEVTM